MQPADHPTVMGVALCYHQTGDIRYKGIFTCLRCHINMEIVFIWQVYLKLVKYGMTVKQSITGAEKLYARKLGRPGQSVSSYILGSKR
jgi:hypothetical protein